MQLVGKNINMKTVTIEDAEFIFKMRHNQNKNKYLSKIQGTIKTQEEWIIKYKEREKENEEFYFLIESKKNEKLGLVRVYDLTKDSFCWGSWIIKENAPKTTAIESALQVYEFAFYKLKYNKSHFDVRINNKKVVSFHKRLGARIVDENELDYFFNLEKSDYEMIKEKYKRYL